jgi:large subunit ribosomal protein L4
MATVKKTTKPTKEVKAAKVVKEVKAPKATPKKAVVKANPLPKETGLKLSVYDTKGKVVESITLPKEIFGAEVNEAILTQAVRVYRANKRRGTVKTKSRGEVKISTRKIYRQKGTGRARHGAASAPIFVGGGIAFGPRPRDYSLKMSQKMRQVALFSSLSSKLKDGEIIVVSGFEKLESKTKNFAATLKTLSLIEKKNQVLLVTPKTGAESESVTKGARNIKGLRVLSANQLNAYDVLSNKHILFMKDSIEAVKETFLKKN